MATGILGQSAPAATTYTTVYTVPAATTATVTVSVCNRGVSSSTVRIAITDTATPLNSEFIEYESSLASYGVLERSGIVMNAAKRVVVYTSSANLSVSVYGFEEAA
jgi:hypothetical protein